jgi:hypothetical protein
MVVNPQKCGFFRDTDWTRKRASTTFLLYRFSKVSESAPTPKPAMSRKAYRGLFFVDMFLAGRRCGVDAVGLGVHCGQRARLLRRAL